MEFPYKKERSLKIIIIKSATVKKEPDVELISQAMCPGSSPLWQKGASWFPSCLRIYIYKRERERERVVFLHIIPISFSPQEKMKTILTNILSKYKVAKETGKSCSSSKLNRKTL